MRKPFICGNWKMNKTVSEALAFINAVKDPASGATGVELAVAPSFTALAAVAEACRGSAIRVGAQNCHWEKSGAFTGEVGAAMLKEAGASFAILGHSERRQYFGETDETVNKRLKAVLDAGLEAIVCVGELLAEREAGQTEAVVTRQIAAGLAGVSPEQMKKATIAYEPVWAIGTGKSADENDAQAVHVLIRGLMRERFGAVADEVRIQYGGSVTPENIAKYLSQPDIDGGLVGGASLDPAKFLALARGGL